MRVRTGARVAAAMVAVGLLLGATPVAASAAQTAPDVASHATAPLAPVRGDANDFTFNSFHGDYTLGRDAEGHSTLMTVETLDAQFPDADQNHGILRAIPLKYDGHPTDVSIVSITDAAGKPRTYTTEEKDDLLMVAIAEKGYLRGSQTYVITYTQKNVTKFFSNTNDDEFYWDTNGTAWQQPFAAATATVHVPADLASSLNGKTACYVGPSGSTTACDLTSGAASGGGTTIETAPQSLRAEENVTVVVGFTPGTFTPRDNAFFSSGAAIATLVFALLTLLVAILALVYRLTALRDAPGRPTIIAEYTPPPGVNVLMVSVVNRDTKRAAAAAFVSLAVRRNIQIVEQEGQGWGHKTVYWLRLVSVDGLDATELALAALLFGSPLQPGAWKQIEKNDTALSKGIYALMQATRKQAVTDGFVRGSAGIAVRGALLLIAAIVFGAASWVGAAAALDGDYGGAVPILLAIVAGIAALATFYLPFKRPLTAAGSELRDYVEGLKLFINVAEKDRFAMLQSPEGALKTQVNAPDYGQVVKIYEKLLPFAVLLNLETEWAKVLGTYYESLGAQPEWYGGNTGAFNSALFVTSIASMSSSVSSSLAASTSSSSSGGSGGGGSSGGGGGGGGGGGL